MLRTAEVLADVAVSGIFSENDSSTHSARTAMTSSKLRLPQLDGGRFLIDGGIESVLIYQDNVQQPKFTAFVLLESAHGRDILRRPKHLRSGFRSEGADVA